MSSYKNSDIRIENLKVELPVKDQVSKGKRIVLPQMYQVDAIGLAYSDHIGIQKTLRSKVFFIWIDNAVKKLICQCLPCQQHQNKLTPRFNPEPLK